MRRLATSACLVAAWLLMLPGMAQAAAGSLDKTFSGDGREVASPGTTSDAWNMAVQPDGKIVMVGSTGPDFSHTSWAVVRLKANGGLDPTFGNGGTTVHDFTAGEDLALAVQVLPGGKLLVAGQAGDRLALGRFLPNGKRDTTFGQHGFVTKDLTTGQDSASDIELLPSGKFLVGGEANGDYVVVRFDPNGGIDTSFGTNGVAITHFSETSFGREIALEPDGRIVETGFLFGTKGGTGVVRLTNGGKPDPTFGGGDGKVVIGSGLGATGAEGWGIQIRKDGKIVIGGDMKKGSADGPFDASMIRLTPGGKPDPTFGGGDGIVLIDMGGTFDSILAMAVQKDGKIVMAGYAGPNGDSAEVLRVKPDGSRDTTFGTNGVANAGFPNAEFWGLGIQKGKIVADGFATGSVDKFAVARFLAS